MVETIYTRFLISYLILFFHDSLPYFPTRERERERDLPSLDSMGYNFHLNLFTLFYHGVEVDFMSSNPPSCNDLVSFIIITSTMLFYGIIKFFAIFFSFCVQKLVFFSVCLEPPLYLL